MWEIIQGSPAKATFRIKDLNTKDPYDFTGNTALSVFLANADGTFLELDTDAGITIDAEPKLGKFEVSLTAEQTADLKVQTNAKLEIQITDADENIEAFQVPLAYTVRSRLSS